MAAGWFVQDKETERERGLVREERTSERKGRDGQTEIHQTQGERERDGFKNKRRRGKDEY